MNEVHESVSGTNPPENRSLSEIMDKLEALRKKQANGDEYLQLLSICLSDRDNISVGLLIAEECFQYAFHSTSHVDCDEIHRRVETASSIIDRLACLTDTVREQIHVNNCMNAVLLIVLNNSSIVNSHNIVTLLVDTLAKCCESLQRHKFSHSESVITFIHKLEAYFSIFTSSKRIESLPINGDASQRLSNSVDIYIHAAISLLLSIDASDTVRQILGLFAEWDCPNAYDADRIVGFISAIGHASLIEDDVESKFSTQFVASWASQLHEAFSDQRNLYSDNLTRTLALGAGLGECIRFASTEESAKLLIQSFGRIHSCVDEELSFILCHGIWEALKHQGDLVDLPSNIKISLEILERKRVFTTFQVITKPFLFTIPKFIARDTLKPTPAWVPIEHFTVRSLQLMCNLAAPAVLNFTNSLHDSKSSTLMSCIAASISAFWPEMLQVAELTSKEGDENGSSVDSCKAIPLQKWVRMQPAVAEANKWWSNSQLQANNFFMSVNGQIPASEFGNKSLPASLNCALVSLFICMLGSIRISDHLFFPSADNINLSSKRAFIGLSYSVFQVCCGLSDLLASETTAGPNSEGKHGSFPDWLVNDIVSPALAVIPELWSVHSRLVSRTLGNSDQLETLLHQMESTTMIMSDLKNLWACMAYLLLPQGREGYLTSICSSLMTNFGVLVQFQTELLENQEEAYKRTVLALFRTFRVFSTKSPTMAVGKVKNAILPPFRQAFVKYVKLFNAFEKGFPG